LIYMDPLQPEWALRIGAKLLAYEKEWFKDILFNNLDVFA